jgi:hypothetical protein
LNDVFAEHFTQANLVFEGNRNRHDGEGHSRA